MYDNTDPPLEEEEFIGPLVELVTISPCHGEGHGFESRTDRTESSPHLCAKRKPRKGLLLFTIVFCLFCYLLWLLDELLAFGVTFGLSPVRCSLLGCRHIFPSLLGEVALLTFRRLTVGGSPLLLGPLG